MSNFRAFIQDDIKKSPRVWREMAQAYSQSQIDFWINQPMANLLSLVPGLNLRGRALNWLVTEGLLEASMKRDELLEKVKAALEGNQYDVVKLKQKDIPQAVPPSGGKKLADMWGESRIRFSEIRADNTFGAFGPDPLSIDDSLTALDLFSPEARKRRPELNEPILEGMTIDEYWLKHMEPKIMVLEYAPGEFKRFDLNKMREKLEALGLEPFYYGTTKGYIQFMEKGDYMEPGTQRQYISPNDQFGIDLRPERTIDRETGRETVVDDVVGTDAKGNPVINFMGGSASADQERANRAVDEMRVEFQRIMAQIEQNKESGLPPEQEAVIRDLLTNKKLLEKMEMELDQKGAGREKAARKISMDDTARGPETVPIPPGLDLELVIDVIAKGLNEPSTKRDARLFGNPAAFGPEWTGEGPEPDGWYRTIGDKLIFKLSKAHQQKALEMITKPLDNDPPMLGARFRLYELVPEAKVGEGVKVITSGMFNAGVRSNPTLLQQAKMYVHKMNGINPKDFTSEQRFQKHPIQAVNAGKMGMIPDPNDQVLSHLRSKGYRWELFTDKEKEQGFPDWKKRGYGIMSMKGSRYKIELSEDDGNFYIYIPTDKAGKPFKPADFGATGQAWLGGGVRYSGGLSGGHVSYNPAGRNMMTTLIDALKEGHFGEPVKGPVTDESELPTITKGIKRARQWYDRKFNNTSSQLWPYDQDLLAPALAGLRGFTGDPAFQVGYVSPQEIQAVLRRNIEQELQKEKAKDMDQEMGGMAGERGGRTIFVYLRRLLLSQDEEITPDLESDVEAQIDAVIQAVMQKIQNKEPIIFIDELGPAIEQAFGHNAFEARLDAVAEYVFAAMKRESNAERDHRKVKAFSSLEKPGKEGETRGFDAGGRGYQSSAAGRGDLKDRQIVRPNDLRGYLGIQDLDDETPTTTGAAQQPVAQPPRQGTAPVNPPTGGGKLAGMWDEPAQPQQPAQPVQPKKGGLAGMWDEGKLKSYGQWLKETATSVVFDPKVKPHDGCGFNYEGAPGSYSGTSISGEADTAKSDPTGKKGMSHGRKAKRK